ncbi:MAG: hypothetical protein ACTHLE_21950 [Agriterribacter sp.]
MAYKWFDYLKSRGNYIVGYTIMPNHVHAIIGFVNTGKPINTVVGNAKRFMAYELISLLRERHQLDYIHMNPCRWNPPLATQPEDYLHSSAKYYLTGKQGVYEVCNYMLLEDVDLTKKR